MSTQTKTKPDVRESIWCLTGRIDATSAIEVFPLNSSPFRIGRRFGLSLTLHSKLVSAIHAEIVEMDGSPWIRDLQSTNGTYVNGERIDANHHLLDGDVVQIADIIFRVGRVAVPGEEHTHAGAKQVQDQALALVQFDKLLNDRSVVPHFQPIVSLCDGNTVGFEALGRSRLFGLETPRSMFCMAHQLNREEELSRVLRLAAISKGTAFPISMTLCLNTTPTEFVSYDLLASLRVLRSMVPTRPITLDVHESAAAHPRAIKSLRDALVSFDMQLAFDDFGARHWNVSELAKVSPDLIKFDAHLIRNVHAAPHGKQKMIADLVRRVTESGIVPLAEGVESQQEHQVLCEMGFQLAQGFYYGRPAPHGDYSGAVQPG